LCDGFSSSGEIRLNGCTIDRNLDCSGASLSNPGGYSLSAAGAHIKGSAYFSATHEWGTYHQKRPFTSNGMLRLEGAEIEGQLDCSGGTFVATAFSSNQADPPDNHIYAISADGLNVGSDILFTQGEDANHPFTASGAISLISARVGGDFSCEKATFNFPGEEALSADGIVVDGTTFFDEVRANGTLRFVQAALKQGFYLNGATFDTTAGCKSWTKSEKNIAAIELGGPSCGVYAPYAEVGGVFWWAKVTKVANADPLRNQFSLFISGSKASSIEDDQSSWEALDWFEVTGCQFEAFVNLSDADTRWRLHELDRQYAQINIDPGWPDLALVVMRACRRLRDFLPHKAGQLADSLREAIKQFKPEPYLQLAKTFRAAGYEAAAQDVLIRLERNKTRYSDIGFFHQFWRYMLDIFLCYGYAPFRPVLIVLAWAAVSATVFQSGYDSGQIVPSKDNQATASDSSPPNQATQPATKPKPPPPTAFNAIVYAVDTLVPIVDLNQKKNWNVQTMSASAKDAAGQSLGCWEAIEKVWRTIPGWGLGLLLIFNTFFGWLMTTLFAAGVSGLLRTEKDS
jgi:hypothetical protein